MFKKIRVSKGNYTIQMTEKKEPRHASVLVWVYNDTTLIIHTHLYTYWQTWRIVRAVYTAAEPITQGIAST